jgi:hypothetical protein
MFRAAVCRPNFCLFEVVVLSFDNWRRRLFAFDDEQGGFRKRMVTW